MDNEEEDTKEDKRDIMSRENQKGNDHKRKYWYCC